MQDFEKDVYREKLRMYVKRKATLDDNMGKVFSLAWGQCTAAMQAKVEAMTGYENVRNNSNLLGLLLLIKQATFDFHSKKNKCHALIDVQKAFVNFRQKRDMTIGEYHEKFKSLVSAYEGCGGSVGNDKGLIVEYLVRMGTDVANADANDVKAAKKGAREEYMATLFIVNSDKSRFGNLIQELENDFVKSNDNYPGTLTGAYILLANRKEDPRYQFASVTAQDNNITFVQANYYEEVSQDEE